MKTILALLVLPIHLTAASLGIFATTGAIAVSNGADKGFATSHQSDFNLQAPTTTSCLNATDLGFSFNEKHWGVDLGYKTISELEYNAVMDTIAYTSGGFGGGITNYYEGLYTASIQNHGFFINPNLTLYGITAGCQLGVMLSNGELDASASYYPVDAPANTMSKYSLAGTNFFYQPSLEYGANLSDSWKVSVNMAYLFLNLKNLNVTNATQQSPGGNIGLSTTPMPAIFNRDLSGFSFSIKLQWSTKITHRPAPPRIAIDNQ